MRCGILTFHRAQNFGAILQAYALQKAIAKLGIECDIIDYRCPFIERYYQPLSMKSLGNPKRIAAMLLRNGSVIDNRSNFEEFTDGCLKTSSDTYKDREMLKAANEIYDVFVTGSDQVWSYLTAGFDKSFFLDFVCEQHKKNSYAASFGVDSIPRNLRTEYEMLLRDFRKISVREEQGARIVEDLTGVRPPVVLDPTLLLDRDEWLGIGSGNMEEHDYLLLYVIVQSRNIISLARAIAKKHNLRIVLVNDGLFRKLGMENKRKLKITEWLDLFLNAAYVVTNSFHGISFAINFQKQFCMQYLPKPAKVNSRLESMLNLFQLQDRHVQQVSELNGIGDIDYSAVHEILHKQRSKSTKYLRSIFDDM